jgi:6,7-dimethyl-8-ribityllumazine synthase
MQPQQPDDIPIDTRDLTIAIITSRYHGEVTEALRDGAVEAFTSAGGDPGSLIHVYAPGAFELPVLCRHCCLGEAIDTPDGIVAIGCVIRGETTHDQHINQAVSNQLAALAVETGIPIGLGVLTCETMEQARSRAGGDKGNKGVEAMHAVLQTIASIQSLGVQADKPV